MLRFEQTLTPKPEATSLWRSMLPALALAALCLAAYWPLLQAGYIWDDNVWLTNNPLVQHWQGLWYIWFAPLTSTQYYPLVYTAFLLQFKLWGLNPLGYHLVNIVLQAINSILLWRILRLLGLKGAWVVAAIFAIHPVQVETVGWITEQKNLLSAAFGFGAAFLWIKWAGLDVTGKMPVPLGSTQAQSLSYNSGQGRSYAKIIAATILFILALLSKTDICTLPVVLLLLAWWKQGRVTRVEILSVIPWLVIGALLASITIYIEHGTAGAQGPVFAFSLSQRLIIAGKDFWFYPFKLLWPHPLMEVYPSWDVEHILPTDWIFGETALGILVILWLLHKKIGRGIFTSVAYYGIIISPVLGFISFSAMIYTFVTDHYQYLACIGIIVLVVESAANGFEKLGEKFAGGSAENRLLRPVVLATGALLLELGVLTWTQCQLYKSPSAIWENVLTYNQNSWLALDQLGYYEYQAGDIKDAEQDERQAYRIVGGNNFVADGTLGVFLLNTHNDYQEGIPLLEQSLRLNPYQPVCTTLLAYCYEHEGQFNRALSLLKDGLGLMPNDPALNISMGEFLESQSQYQAALNDFQQALRYQPMNAACLFDCASVLKKSGREQEAIAEYSKAVDASATDKR